MSHSKKVKLLYVGNECTDSYCCYYSYEKKNKKMNTSENENLWSLYLEKKCNKISLISQCASILSDGFSTSFTLWHQSSNHLHCIYVANQVLLLAKGTKREVALLKQYGCGEPCPLHEALHLSGTDMCLLLQRNKATMSVFMLECSIKKKGSFLSTLISLCGIIPLCHIYGTALFTKA